MDVNAAIEIIKGCDRSAEEKLHLRRLVGNGTIMPASFAGTPNFADILEEFPVASVAPGVGSAPVAPVAPVAPPVYIGELTAAALLEHMQSQAQQSAQQTQLLQQIVTGIARPAGGVTNDS